MMAAEWVVPGWPAPPGVQAFVTTRQGGVSEGAHASLNLGGSSGDVPDRVKRNREIVRAYLPSEPRWMRQVHGASVVNLDDAGALDIPEADGAVTSLQGAVAVVLVADCMPVFLCDEDGARVGVVHAGWRGMAAGVIENAVAALGTAPAKVLAWMGPALGPQAFEVGEEVRDAFLATDPGAGAAFEPGRPGKLMGDLYALARRRFERAGVHRIHGGGFCTFNDERRFFSYRREKASGRMGAFIWRR